MNALAAELAASGIPRKQIAKVMAGARRNAQRQGIRLADAVHQIAVARWLYKARQPDHYAATCSRRERVGGTPLAEHLDSEGLRGHLALQCDMEGRPGSASATRGRGHREVPQAAKAEHWSGQEGD